MNNMKNYGNLCKHKNFPNDRSFSNVIKKTHTWEFLSKYADKSVSIIEKKAYSYDKK